MSELVIRKVSTILYFLTQLKKSRVATRELLLFNITCIRSILEYGSPVFHRALPNYLSKDLERLQKHIMKIIYPELWYANALEQSRFLTLDHRREAIVAKLFEICAYQCHILHKLPAKLLSERKKMVKRATGSEFAAKSRRQVWMWVVKRVKHRSFFSC